MSSYPPTPQRKACNCSDPCISTDDVYYAGPNLPNSGVNTSDVLTIVIEKLDAIYAVPTLQKVTEMDNLTTLPIIADSFVKIGGDGTNVLLDNGTTISLSSIGGNQNLQSVTTEGATTDKIVTFNNEVIVTPSPTGRSIYCATSDDIGLEVNMNETGGIGILIKRQDAPLATPFQYEYYNGDDGITTILTSVNAAGELTAQKLIKDGGSPTEFLMADGSVTTAVPFIPGDYDLDQFTNTGIDPFAHLSDIPAPLGYTPVNKAGDTMLGDLILNQDPSNALGAATKQYVDNISSGINFHFPVVVATDVSLVATYNNGVDGVGATLTGPSVGVLMIDGETPTYLQRILVWQQADPIQNGVYDLTTVGDSVTVYQLTRSSDADNSPPGEIHYGDYTLVLSGDTNGGFGFICNTPGVITIGVTPINYIQFNAAQAVTAGYGLEELNPNVISIDPLVTQEKITLTTTGTTGAATFITNTLNIPTLPQATSSVSGYLTSTDWNTFNGKANTLYSFQANETGSARTLALTDLNTIIPFTINGTVTIPNNSVVLFPIGSVVGIYNINAALLLISAASGVTIVGPDIYVSQGDLIFLVKFSTNTWIIQGTSNNEPIFKTLVTSPRFQATTGYTFSDANTGMQAGNAGLKFVSYTSGNAGDVYTFNPFYNNATIGVGIQNNIVSSPTVNPTSGSVVFNMVNLSPTINQTGGANGITRGLYINPTLTSAADFRAIEVTAGKVIVPNGTASNEAVNKGQLDAALPTFLEYNAIEKTVWNNGQGNLVGNTTFGQSSLISISSSNNNTAFGYNSLNALSNGGNNNTGIGFNSLSANNNEASTAVGSYSMVSNTGGYNTAVGSNALYTGSGSSNVAIGVSALQDISTGSNNVAIGASAGRDNSVMNDSVFIGQAAKPLASGETNQIVIGRNAVGAGSNTATLGNDSITSTILKGLVKAPLTTNALIDADTTGKAVVTKEYVNNRLVVETTSGYTLTNADSGGIVIFKTTAAQTLTIPTGLADGFECTFVTLSGVTLTVVSTVNTLNNATSTTMLPQLSFTLKRMIAANTYIVAGSL